MTHEEIARAIDGCLLVDREHGYKSRKDAKFMTSDGSAYTFYREIRIPGYMQDAVEIEITVRF